LGTVLFLNIKNPSALYASFLTVTDQLCSLDLPRHCLPVLKDNVLIVNFLGQRLVAYEPKSRITKPLTVDSKPA
jgi:hypothetical protein